MLVRLRKSIIISVILDEPSKTDAVKYSNFNSQINAIRRRNNNGVYDVHTNTMQYPTIMQPTAVRVEQIPPSTTSSTDNASQVFPVLSPNIPRNFMVTDTYYEMPPAGISAASYDARAYSATGGEDFLASFRGLGAVSDDVKDALPAECREAFDEALAKEKNWHGVREPLSFIP